MKPESSAMALKCITDHVILHFLCQIQLVYVLKAMDVLADAKAKIQISSLHPSHFDLYVKDAVVMATTAVFVCGHGPEMKRDWWFERRKC